MSRYTIHYVADQKCDSLRSDVIAATDDAAQAQCLADINSGAGTYGVGIRDSDTGLIDFGRGFGVAIPEQD